MEQDQQQLFATRGERRTAGWARVSHGLHVPVGGSPLHAWRLLLPDDGVFTGVTAAELLGWWMPELPTGYPVFAAVRDGSVRVRRAGIQVSRHPVALPGRLVAGLPVAEPPEVLLACARHLAVLDLVVLVDAALHLKSCTRADIEAVLSQGRRGSPRLRRALRLADHRSESAWESLLRVLHVACDVPVVPQFVVTNRYGDFVARADLRVGETRTLHEYDGGEHRKVERHRRDLRRERALGAQGWTRRGYSAPEVRSQGMVILREADQALGRAHDPRRLRRWSTLLGDSTFSPRGRAELAQRWRLR